MDLEHVREHVERIRLAKQVTAEMKQMADDSRGVIEEAMGESEVGELDGKLAITWKHNKIRRLNQKALKEDHPDIAAEYTELSAERRFEVK